MTDKTDENPQKTANKVIHQTPEFIIIGSLEGGGEYPREEQDGGAEMVEIRADALKWMR